MFRNIHHSLIFNTKKEKKKKMQPSHAKIGNCQDKVYIDGKVYSTANENHALEEYLMT